MSIAKTTSIRENVTRNPMRAPSGGISGEFASTPGTAGRRVVVTGSLSYDYIMNFSGKFADRIMPEKIHQISLSFLVDTLKREFGGTAGNIAYTLHLLGLDPEILSVGGNDFEPYFLFLKKRGIRTDGISIDKRTATSSYFVVTDRDDNQIGSFYVGATKYASGISISSYIADTPHSFVIIAPTDPAAMNAYVRECRAAGIPYMYDPAFQIGTFSPDDLRDGLGGAAILIGNDYEIALIEEKLGISHEELIMMVPVTVTTLGAKGSIIETRKESIHVRPAKPKRVVDPTGAGDAYRAGFLAGYVRGYDLPTCGRMGSVAAVYTVEKYGTVTHTFTTGEFAVRYRENFNEDLPAMI